MSKPTEPSSPSIPQTSSPFWRLFGTAAKTTVITFRHNSELVYVKPSKSHRDAVLCAQSSFAALSRIPADRITLSCATKYDAPKKGPLRRVRVSSAAWPEIYKKLKQYEVVDVDVVPLVSFGDKMEQSKSAISAQGQSTSDSPPRYNAADLRQASEKAVTDILQEN